MEVQRSVEIAVPPEKVWPLLVEPDKILQWFTLLRKFEYTGDKRSGVDTTFYYEEKTSGQLLKIHFVVTEWVENQKLAFSVTSGSLKKDDQVWSIDVTPSGCRFTMFEDMDMPMGIIGKIVGALFGDRIVGGHIEHILANLKRMAEA